jgi:membrane-bound lytic murein transglycosylase MltF
MQVMPETGRSLDVGDVAQLEPNIHAGVKYIRYVIDNYYAKEPMTPLNRTLFAFASYNAGPGRIQSLRREAARRGFDPNVWFGNVEFVTAEAIGQETATYVANIYKYYVAYALVADAEQRNREARGAIEGHAAGAAGPAP